MKKIIIISSVVVAILAIIVIVKYNAKTYLDIIYRNWDIELSENYKEIYSTDSGASFLGDGERYTVFECDDFAMGNKNFEWEKSKNEANEDMILSIISELSIKKDYEINFQSEYEYFYKQQADDSQLFIVHNLDNNLIYVIENLI